MVRIGPGTKAGRPGFGALIDEAAKPRAGTPRQRLWLCSFGKEVVEYLDGAPGGILESGPENYRECAPFL